MAARIKLFLYRFVLHTYIQKEEAEIHNAKGGEMSFEIEPVIGCNCLVYMDAGLSCDSPICLPDHLTIWVQSYGF